MVIVPLGLGIQHHRDFMLDEVRQLQVVLRFHGNADVRNGRQHGALRSVLGLVAENLGPAPLVRVKVSLPVGAQGRPQTLTTVQEIHLGPQVNEALGGRRAGQQDHPLDETADSPHGLKALALGVLKAGTLIQDHHVKGPGLLVVVHQPLHIFPVDDVDVRRGAEGLYALGRAPQHRGDAQVLQVVPPCRLLLPGGLRHLFGGHHQHLGHLPAEILEDVDGGKRDAGFAQAGPQEQTNGGEVRHKLDAIGLVVMRYVLHPQKPPSKNLSRRPSQKAPGHPPPVSPVRSAAISAPWPASRFPF